MKINRKIYTAEAQLIAWQLRSDWRFANEYENDDYDDDYADSYGNDYDDDSISDEELAAQQPYPDYELEDLQDDANIELPTFGASAANIDDILDDLPPDEPQPPVIW